MIENDLLLDLMSELLNDTNGFAETFPKGQQTTIKARLMLSYTVTLGEPLRDFVRSRVMVGYRMVGDWFESLDGMHKINLPEIGRQYAKHLEFIGL